VAGLHPGVLRTERRRVRRGIAADLVEEAYGNPLAEPVRESLPRLFAHIEGHTLPINRVFGLDAGDVTQFIDDQSITINCERFAVAFREFVFSEAVAGQLNAKAKGNLVA